MTRANVLALHRTAPVTLGYVNPWFEYGRGTVSARSMFTQRRPWAQQSVPLLRRGGVDFVVYSHGNNARQRISGANETEYMLRCFDALIVEAERHPHTVLIRTRRDLDRARRERKLGIILHLTGAPIHGSLEVFRTYHRLGVRAAHPYVNDDRLGGYAGGDRRVGLRPFGRRVLREMERLGMLVDVTHANDRCLRETMRAVTKPVMDSHTCCRALRDVERNRTDDQLRAIAGTGGVVGVHFSSSFLERIEASQRKAGSTLMKSFHKKLAAMERKYKDPYEFLAHRWDPFEWPKALGGAIEDSTKIRRATIRKLVDHIDHMVEVAGIDHVGIGSDYDLGDTCGGVETADKLPNLTRELVRRGYRPNEIRKILGGNFLRLYAQVLPS